MASSHFSSSSKQSSPKTKKVYSQERINHATYAFDHLSEMIEVLRYHTIEQKNTLGTESQSSPKDSQSLMKTLLSAYKQMDSYLEIIDPPMYVSDEQELEDPTEVEIVLDKTMLLSNDANVLNPDFVEEENPEIPFAQTIYSELPSEEFPIQIGDGDTDAYSSWESDDSTYRHTKRYNRR